MRLATKKLPVSVDAVVGLELLATTLADKHMATVLPNCVLVSRLQKLESLVTYISEVNPLFCVYFLLNTEPIQQQQTFPHKPIIDIFRSRCQQLSTPLHVLPTAYPSLEDNIVDDTVDPSVCHHLG